MNDFLNKLKKLGIEVWLKDEHNLGYRAPKGVMNQSLLNELKKNKLAIIRDLSEKTHISHDHKNQYQPFRLTDMQSAYLRGQQLSNEELGGIGCCTVLELEAPPIDAVAFETAWHKTIETHPMLKAIVNNDGTQSIQETVKLPTLVVHNVDSKGCIRNSDTVNSLRNELKRLNFGVNTYPLHKFIVCNGQERSIIFLVIDMLIADYPSINNIITDIFLYYLHPEKKTSKNNELVTFRDIIVHNETHRNEQLEEQSKQYWMQKLKRFNFNPPELPVKTIKHDDEPEFFRKDFFMPSKTWEKFQAYSKKYNITPSNAILCLYAEVIKRWSEKKDFCINITTMQRDEQSIELVGDFSSTSLLEIQNHQKRFCDAAQDLQLELFKNLEHSRFSGIQVLREVNKKSHHRVIMPIVFTSTIGVNLDTKKSMTATEKVAVVGGISKTPQVWIDCQLLNVNGGLQINWDYRDNILSDGIITDMFESFCRTLNTLSTDNLLWKDKQLIQLKNCPPRQLDNTLPSNEAKLIHDNIINNIKNTPNSIVLTHNTESYTYGELGGYVSLITQKLLENGVKSGDTVAIILEKGILQVASSIAVLNCGGIFVHISKQETNTQKAILIEHFNPKVILENEQSKVSNLKSIIIEKVTDNSQKLTIDNLPMKNSRVLNSGAYIVYEQHREKLASVTVSHKIAYDVITNLNSQFEVSAQDNYLSLAELSQNMGIFDLFSTLNAGAHLILMDNKESPTYWIECIKKAKISILSSSSNLFALLLSETNATQSLKDSNKLRLALISGETYSFDNFFEDFANQFSIINLYEYQKIGVWGAYRDINGKKKWLSTLAFEHHVLDENLVECPSKVHGEIFVKLNPEIDSDEVTQYTSTNRSELIRTGIIGYYDANGILQFKGTKSRNIRQNGHKIALSQLEKVILEVSGKRSIIVPYKENSGNDCLIAFVESPEKHLFKTSCEQHFSGINRNLFHQWKTQSEKCTIADILNMFHKADVFRTTEADYDLEKIYQYVQPAEDYKQSIKRMLRALTENNILDKVNENYRLSSPFMNREAEWEKFLTLEEKIGHGRVLFDYQKTSGECLLEQIRGHTSSLSLFFPQGSTAVANSAYAENLINNRLNSITADIVKRSYDKKQSLRILELGAGVGGTTTKVLKSLPQHNIEYFFTDISNFFINKAKENYKKYKNISYHLLNINKDFSEQNFNESNFDIILCANVLHNSRHIIRALSQIKQLLKENGELIIIEATCESLPLLTSLELKGGLGNYSDFRKESKEIFISYDKWPELLEESGFNTHFILPQKNDELSECGQGILYCTPTDSENIRQDKELMHLISDKLPSYTLPNKVLEVDTLPIDINGLIKYDQVERLLQIEAQSLAARSNKFTSSNLSTINDKLKIIWQELLHVDEINITDNFYSLGGDSLLIAQVVKKMKEELSETELLTWDELMEIVLENPSIEGISQKILKHSVSQNAESIQQNSNATDKPPVKPLYEKNQQVNHITHYKLNPENNAKTTAVFHSGTGRLIDYSFLVDDLKTQFSDEHAIIGFSYGSRDAFLQISENELILKRAKMYADELMKLNSESYEMLGYCVGGFLAFEVSKILLDNGFNVVNTVIVSSHLCRHKVTNQLLMEYAYGRGIGLNMQQAGYDIDDMELREVLQNILKDENRNIKNSELVKVSGNLGDFFADLLDYSHEERLSSIFETAAATTFNGDNSTKSMLAILYDIFEHTYKGMMFYKPNGFYAGNVTVLTPNESGLTFYPDLDEDVNWENLCIGPLIQESIDGNHGTCLNEENYKQVLKHLVLKN